MWNNGRSILTLLESLGRSLGAQWGCVGRSGLTNSCMLWTTRPVPSRKNRYFSAQLCCRQVDPEPAKKQRCNLSTQFPGSNQLPLVNLRRLLSKADDKGRGYQPMISGIRSGQFGRRRVDSSAFGTKKVQKGPTCHLWYHSDAKMALVSCSTPLDGSGTVLLQFPAPSGCPGERILKTRVKIAFGLTLWYHWLNLKENLGSSAKEAGFLRAFELRWMAKAQSL